MLEARSMIKGVIFDLDGTLMHANLDFSYLRNVTGCPPDQDILRYINSLAPKNQVIANKMIVEHEIKDAMSAEWIDGAIDFVELLAREGTPMAIVTRNCRRAAELKLSSKKAMINIVITREDAPPKPDPSALLDIARNWQMSVTDLIYIGDYLYDVQAAKNAGMRSFLYVPEEKPDYAHQADVVFKHYDEMKVHFPHLFTA